jgi:hypothetical protein
MTGAGFVLCGGVVAVANFFIVQATCNGINDYVVDFGKNYIGINFLNSPDKAAQKQDAVSDNELYTPCLVSIGAVVILFSMNQINYILIVGLLIIDSGLVFLLYRIIVQYYWFKDK